MPSVEDAMKVAPKMQGPSIARYASNGIIENVGLNLLGNTILCIYNNNYTCIKCQAPTLPFLDSDNIDFQCALFGDGKTPCKKCKRDILQGMQCTNCIVCNTLYHFDCIPKRHSGGSKSARKKQL